MQQQEYLGQRMYDEIADQLLMEQSGVSIGRIMSTPAITYHHKVFAFYAKKHNKMVFRFGKMFLPTTIPSTGCRPFNPFVNKGPLAGWYEVDYSEKAQWYDLALLSLQNLKKEVDKN
ncbi:hypothetical protein [Longirhabdus pacifica]|uniref:hypothetical protein n=1 Tax=Longirhabdus pacifica TaxID=2305227 RepID=UPI00100887B0|nr:hypothetical protein [Longirhabdus pacifica]